MTVAIYTSAFGAFDELLPQAEQDVDVEWIAFTDQLVPEPWQRMPAVEHFPHPRMSAKWYKCLPTVELPHRFTIWIDANTEVTSPAFAREALASLNDGIAVFAHPHRDCIYDEAEASVRLAPAKYAHLPIREQVAHYRSQGHPEHVGLYACGTVARDRSMPGIGALGRAWLAECMRWTYQDQLSFPVVCRRMGIKPGIFPHPQVSGRHMGNLWQTIHPHRSDT
jgi:alkaline ceramidase TOD1/glycosyltransferase MUCI70-like protein